MAVNACIGDRGQHRRDLRISRRSRLSARAALEASDLEPAYMTMTKTGLYAA